jgi:hypothetical protein
VWEGSGGIATRSFLPEKVGLTGKASDLYFGGARIEYWSGRVVSRDFSESIRANDEVVSIFSRRSLVSTNISITLHLIYIYIYFYI